MRKALLLAYHYPPLGGVAVMRVLRFSRYLKECGWDPIVLCVDGGAKHEPRDQGLVQEIPSDILIERVKCLEPDNYTDSWDVPREKVVRNLFKTFDKVLFPDDRALWVKPVTKRALSLIRKHKVEVVWATAQPWSTLVAGRNIKRASGLPLVLDFRDDWTTSNSDFRKIKRLAKEQALEQTVLAQADAVVSVTPNIVEELKKRAPSQLTPEQFHYIPNGFDPAHFDTPPAEKRDKFAIVHAGGLYHLRPITPLLKVLDAWFAKHPERAKNVEIKLAGRTTDQVKEEIAASRWASLFDVMGFLEHKKIRSLIMGAQANLLMIEQVKTAPWLFTGKVFEYIGAGRPIVMIGPDPSPLAKILRDTGLGLISGYEQPEETAEQLESLYGDGLPTLTSENEAAIDQYNARHQTARLGEIFMEVTSGRE